MDQFSSGQLILAICMIVGAVADLRSRRIPNWLSLVTAIGGLAFAAIDGWSSTLLWHLASMILALAIGMLLFGLKMWGGGDGKFFAASAAWFPLSDFILLVVGISIAGLALALFWLARGALMRRPDKSKSKLPALPYGVAIALGAIAVAIYSSPVAPATYTI
ncbi:MAG: prepilin peptidase [Erythrobacter sp.]|nr:prepilin peptidase [Erythrobacter sp.]